MFCFSLQGQKRSYHKDLGQIYFSKKSYLAAIPHLRKAIRRNSASDTLITYLALSYYYTRQLENASRTFQYMEQKKYLKDSLLILNFQNLKQLGKYQQAKKWAIAQNYSGLTSLISYCDSSIAWTKKTKAVKITNLKKLNSEFSETCPSLHMEGLYFLSNRESLIIEKKAGVDGLPYQSAYLSKYNVDSTLRNPGLYTALSTDKYHAGSAYFVEDSMVVYYTKVQRDRDNVLRSKLYLEDLRKKSLVPRKLFILNDSLYSFMHPCMDKEQKLFFFSSKMPGGFGGNDIYVSIRIENIWSAPINLGPKVNSSYNDLFPFYDSEGRLFFSSDRPEGMGGFDIFMAKQVDGEWESIQNLRAPINSSNDEMGFVIHKSMKRAYFSSNRSDGEGREDIYEVSGRLFLLFDK